MPWRPITLPDDERLVPEELLFTVHDSTRAHLLRNTQWLALCAFSLRRLDHHCDRRGSFCWWPTLILPPLDWRRGTRSWNTREKLLHGRDTVINWS